MKTYKKLLIAAVIVVVAVGLYIAYQQKSYYPMAGEVTIIDKSKSGFDYFIVIEDTRGEQFTLSCNENDYNQVSIGETINCERNESIVTHKGEVHKIKPIS